MHTWFNKLPTRLASEAPKGTPPPYPTIRLSASTGSPPTART